jgi:hypothetical protein
MKRGFSTRNFKKPDEASMDSQIMIDYIIDVFNYSARIDFPHSPQITTQ